jgi:putative peptidoglycan lipid II flippase
MTVISPPASEVPPVDRHSGHRQLLGALLVVGGVSVVARLAFVARDLVVAGKFGTTEELDAYLLAFTFPSFAVAVISGAFNAALIPTLIRVRHDAGHAAAQKLLSNASVINATLLALSAFVFGIAAPYALPLLGSHLTAGGLLLARRLTFILLPSLLLSGFSTTWSAVLNAENSFAVPASAPAATALVPLGLLLVMPGSHRVFTLAVGTVLGYAAEASFVGFALHRRGFSLIPTWHGLDSATRTVLNQYGPVVAGSFVLTASTLVNQALAGMLGPGTISSLSYGTKLVSLVLSIGALSLSTAVLPHFSRKVAAGDIAGVRQTLRLCAFLVVACSLPFMAAIIYFSRPIVGLVFQRGAFTADDADVVGRIQRAFVLQIPSYLMGMVLVRLISSIRANHILFWVAVINLTVSCALGYCLARAFGVVGIALTTSVVSAISCAYLALMARISLGKLVTSVPSAKASEI